MTHDGITAPYDEVCGFQQPPLQTMTFIHVHHVKYTVSDLDCSVKFYLLDPGITFRLKSGSP